MTNRKLLSVSGMLAMVVLSALLLGADAAPSQVTCVDIQNYKVELVGNLGRRLGTYMTIEATLEKPPMKETRFIVDQVDGKKLEKLVVLEIQTNAKTDPGTRYTFRGYETAAMTSTPQDPESKENFAPQQSYHFSTWFEVTQVKSKTPVMKD